MGAAIRVDDHTRVEEVVWVGAVASVAARFLGVASPLRHGRDRSWHRRAPVTGWRALR
jgi:hypothetical protein